MHSSSKWSTSHEQNPPTTLPGILTRDEYIESTVNRKSRTGFSPLTFAVAYDKTGEATELLLSHSANVNSEHSEQINIVVPLFVAIQSNNHACMELLLAHGANVNLKDAEGMGALHIAAGFSDLEAFGILVAADIRVAGTEDRDFLTIRH